jgi:hypothetical protein
MEINADDLENFEEKIKKNMKPKKEKKIKLSKKMMLSIIKPPTLNKPVENNNNEEINKYIQKTTNPVPEIKNNSKKVIFKIASLSAKGKSNILQEKLETSEYLNKYLDNNLYLNCVDTLNSHYKAALCYVYYFTETILT